jgi:O-methyltransferase
MARDCGRAEVVEERNPLIQTIENIAEAALSSLETCRSTYAIARQALEEGIPGDFVECGVYAGAQAAIMAKAIGCVALREWEPRRRVHLFDSFEGCPSPGPKDKEFLEAGHKNGQASCTLEGVKANMAQWGIPEELLVYHPGWFYQTVPYHAGVWCATSGKFAPGSGPIAVLRLDADLYESTVTCLEHLYPLLSPGGFLIVDDYALSGARQAVEDYFDRNGGRGPMYMRKAI